MDCHSCEYLRYDGCKYGRCAHRGHADVRLSLDEAKARASKGMRDYNRKICPDYVKKRRCSNCKYWIRGAYFADGRTPAVKGHCSLRVLKREDSCPVWREGPTSWKKRKA